MTLGTTLHQALQHHQVAHMQQNFDTSSFSCCSFGCGDDDVMATDVGATFSNPPLMQGTTDGDSCRVQDWDINDVSFELVRQ